jgi:L-glutamine-phosphate cytidylyltransferase
MIKKAVIVAAGLSSRLYPLTIDKPKGLLEINGISLLKRSIDQLKANGIEEIAIVLGYRQNQILEELRTLITPILNPFYKECNNMGSLWFAKPFVNSDPFVYLHGDLIYDPKIISDSKKDFEKSNYKMQLLVDYMKCDAEAMKVNADKDDIFIESSKEIKDHIGEWTGIAYLKEPAIFFDIMEKVMLEEGLNFYDTHAMNNLAKRGYKIHCRNLKGLPWKEIDFLEDFETAKVLFKSYD